MAASLDRYGARRVVSARKAAGSQTADNSRTSADPANVPTLHCDLQLPLVLDLEGSLLATNTLLEALFLFLKRQWSRTWQIPVWALAGGAVIKEKLAASITPEDAEFFPVNRPLEQFARNEAELGRMVVLVTAADRLLAERLAARFPFVSKIISSNNSAGRECADAAALDRLFPQGFVYVGGTGADVYIRRLSEGAVFPGAPPRAKGKARQAADVVASLPKRGVRLNDLQRGLRLHQWAKNALIFAPLVLGGKAGSFPAWAHAAMAFFAFGLLASATYLLNDIWDLHEDRQHWSKRTRPIASGELSIGTSVGLIALLGFCAFGLGAIAGTDCVAMLALYFVMSLSYSFRLKREPVIDVFLLATLFTMRLAMGVVVTHVIFSPWLFVFSMFLFLSLSLAKRQTEIGRMIAHGKSEALGRGYNATDAPFVLAAGVASMMAAVLVMVIYLTQDAFPKGFYRHPNMLWALAAIIFLWLARVWLLCCRGELNDDPVTFALKDRLSLFYAAMMGVILITATL